MKNKKILFEQEILKKGIIPLFYNNDFDICKSISMAIIGIHEK